ncbi:hypothetical protein H2200_009177 [Cladophialophora chaetospira]|uniref:Transcription factor domain-containing protein n=1 Tax=Cladophialophora chaetospira TaxID=386627 RepID=A0AA38X3M7_9EURO|nr:hypothetical protein H2200_009177 [Cladophialophora chaetospira]
MSSPCSNCRKWRKPCTIDWIRSHQKRQPRTATRPRASKEAAQLAEEAALEEPSFSWNSDLPTEEVGFVIGDHLNKSISNGSSQDNFNFVPEPNILVNNYSVSQHDPSTNSQEFVSAYDYPQYGFAEAYVNNNGTDHSAAASDFPAGSVSASSHKPANLGFWSTPISNDQSTTSAEEHKTALEDTTVIPFVHDNGPKNAAVSPFSSYNLSETLDRVYIKKGLLKIYHDSLEGALSCWLTERNCPYASSPFVDGDDVWSSKWSNRIVTRVRALDETYLRAGLLSKEDQKQASNVLSLVVMAFAVQWAQTTYSSHDNLETQLPEHGVFGRNMQKALWHKASMALSQAAGNRSNQVIFAAVVFSLTQRPMDSAEVLADPGTRSHGNLASLRRVLDDDEGPIFLDVAVRKLHDHQRRLKDAEHASHQDSFRTHTSQILGEQDKQTFGLLFWLAVMFDTLSAAMNRRAFTLDDGETRIRDEDSLPTQKLSTPAKGFSYDLDGYSSGAPPRGSYLTRDSQIWGNYFLRQHSRVGDLRKQTTRWPCSYTDAAACLADAAPVKVLVFRRLGHLQDLYYQQAPQEAIEDAIAAALEVYNHWKATYGLFITDCVNNHEGLPPRIQSWYILLASHWNLAILLLADLVEKLDDLGMTLPANRNIRQATEFAETLRMRSVYAVSDLGRCSRLSSEDLSFSQSSEFHHAVNKAALLTEPWTVVLVRAFAHAGEVLVKVVLSRRGTGLLMDAINLAEARSRLDDCIEALWLLSRKSDMALQAAKILQGAVDLG